MISRRELLKWVGLAPVAIAVLPLLPAIVTRPTTWREGVMLNPSWKTYSLGFRVTSELANDGFYPHIIKMSDELSSLAVAHRAVLAKMALS